MASNDQLLEKLEEMSRKMEEMQVEINKQSKIADHLTGYFQILDLMKAAMNINTIKDSFFGSSKHMFLTDEDPFN